MKLSEALRKGAEGREQIVLRYFDSADGCCALGAIIRGANIKRNGYLLWGTALMQVFPELETRIEWPGAYDLLLRYIAYLNDIKQLSFEEIAADLEAKGY